jgi:hypothetical protein
MKRVRLYTEFAGDDESRALGLMYRSSLGLNSGMLFSFASPRPLSFWMKDTQLPLDIAYVTADRRILEIKKLNPYSTRSVASSAPCQYAIEANSGFFESNAISAGSRIVLAQEADLPASPDIPGPSDTPEQQDGPQQIPEGQSVQPHPSVQPDAQDQGRPDLVVNMSVMDVVPVANRYKLAIAFDYQLPNGNNESYYMLPLQNYQIIPGKNSRLICGPCSHSFGEFRNFKIDNILGYDLYETVGPRKGRRVAPPVAQPGGNKPDVSMMPAAASMRSSFRKESQADASSTQYMMTEYWDAIAKKRDEGKTEGEAILEYLSENTKKESPKRRDRSDK